MTTWQWRLERKPIDRSRVIAAETAKGNFGSVGY